MDVSFSEYEDLTKKEYTKMCRFLSARLNEIHSLNVHINNQDNKIAKLNNKVNETFRKTKEEKMALRQIIQNQENEIKKLSNEIQELTDQNKKLKAQLERDYTSSSKPSSMSANHKKISNSRIKTNKKPGGQKGHEHHPRKFIPATKSIHLPDPECVQKNPESYVFVKSIHKSVVNIQINVEVQEYVGNVYRLKGSNKLVKSTFPEEAKDETNYGGSVKAFACLLNNYCNVSIQKTKEIIEGITNNTIQISTGKINSLTKEFSENTKENRSEIFSKLFCSSYLHTDATYIRLNGTTNYVYISANPDYVHYVLKEHKGFEGITDTPVDGYEGVLIHDHDKTLFHYGKDHQKCLAHEIRYLQDSINNESERNWNKTMKSFLQGLIHQMKQKQDMDFEKISKEYDDIIEMGQKEYEEKPAGKYYRDGYNTWKRLKEYKDSVLYFVNHPEIPYTNNLAERKARQIKRKTKQVGAFRGFETTQRYCDFMTIVETGKSQGENIYGIVCKYFKKASD